MWAGKTKKASPKAQGWEGKLVGRVSFSLHVNNSVCVRVCVCVCVCVCMIPVGEWEETEREIIAIINSHHVLNTYNLSLGLSSGPLITICVTLNRSFKFTRPV